MARSAGLMLSTLSAARAVRLAVNFAWRRARYCKLPFLGPAAKRPGVAVQLRHGPGNMPLVLAGGFSRSGLYATARLAPVPATVVATSIQILTAEVKTGDAEVESTPLADPDYCPRTHGARVAIDPSYRHPPPPEVLIFGMPFVGETSDRG